MTGGLSEGFMAAIYAAIAGFVVGGIVRFASLVLNSGKTELQMHVALRKELREELDAVKKELKELQDDIDSWKEKYFHQVELTNQLKVDIHSLTEELQDYRNNFCPLGNTCDNNPLNEHD